MNRSAVEEALPLARELVELVRRDAVESESARDRVSTRHASNLINALHRYLAHNAG